MKTRFPGLILLTVLLLSVAALAAPRPKLKKTQLPAGITLGVPEGFTALPDEGIAAKFPAPRKPLAVFSDRAGRVDLSIAQKETPFGSADYGLLIKIYKASIQNMYTKVTFLTEDIRTINKRDFIVLEFTSELADTRRNGNLPPIRKYQLVQYAIEGKTLNVFTFNAPLEEQAKWQPTAQAVMQSISMK